MGTGTKFALLMLLALAAGAMPANASAGPAVATSVSTVHGQDATASAAVDLLWSRFSTPLFPAFLELLVAARTDAELRKHLKVVEERLAHAMQRQVGEVFGPASSKAPGYALAIDLTLNLMYGMALQRVLAPPDARQLRRRELAMVSAWKGVVTRVLEKA